MPRVPQFKPANNIVITLYLTLYVFSCRRWLFWRRCSAKVLAREVILTPPILWVVTSSCSIHCMGEHEFSWHKHTRAGQAWVSRHKHTRVGSIPEKRACICEVSVDLTTACTFLQWMKSFNTNEHLLLTQDSSICVKLPRKLCLLLRYIVSVADLEGVPWVPWNPSFEGLPSRVLSKSTQM